MTLALCLAFVLSGAAALLFETLWFRLAGLALGNSVWASSAVLASFMAGLAIGNALAAQRGERLRRPLRTYAVLEVVVAVLGTLLVFCFPALTDGIAPVLASIGDGWGLGAMRLTVAFALLLVPAAAMGTTLPLVATALTRAGGRFAVVLGLLYGWNTVGAVLGAVAGEMLLIPQLGLRGTALFAALLNLLAAAVALALDHQKKLPAAEPAAAAATDGRLTARLLAAAFLSGGALLGLEVVWLRVMQLMVFTTAMAFAMMLATILAGIGAGSLLASAWLRRFGAGGVLPVTALAAGGATYLAYMSIDPSALSRLQAREDVLTLALSALLMLPTSLASGVLFTLTGAALREQVPNDTRAAGRLTLANTVGAAAGAPVTGLLLLPFLGAERSLFSLALVYAVIAWCLLPWRADRGRLILVPATVMFALLAAAFPFGLLQGRLLKQALQPYVGPESGVLTVKESPTEFAALIRETWAGAPLQDRLITNHHSMTGTGFSARRYMKLFAYWPLAMRPEARSALLISYGVGNTGEALTRAPWLERIDVVDISRGIADLSPFVHRPGWGDPLADPRVRLRIEDGRFHLLAGSERYDIVTAEPPPPSAAGVVNLFTSEYFALVRRRLAPGGIATHWLPVHLLSVSDSRAITRAFCDIFADCSLWAGAGDDWMLVGSTGLRRPAANDLGRLWREPRTAQDLAEIGVEGPAQLAATFLADAPTLYRWYQGALPLTDDQPGRLSQRRPAVEDRSSLRQLAQGASAASFSTSAAMHQLWPPDALAGIERAFADELILDRYYHDPERPGAARELWDVLANSRQRTLPLVMLGSDPRVAALARERAVAGDQHPALSYHLGAIALSERNYTAAAALLSRADAPSGVSYPPLLLEAIALGLVGRVDEARAALHRFPANGLVEHAQTWKADVLALLDMERPKTAKTRAVDLRH